MKRSISRLRSPYTPSICWRQQSIAVKLLTHHLGYTVAAR
ncbi:hypothetical protein COO91_09071 [Nostoc flagelliforme CCNUN1]|uniref:Uncharacterized protein n=1 Tax=Nostoc flagelliforme CCNUN1 TaxID=2038116 RepID=A0A2K8T5L8_9NOSO|nr:hypothetical protein COO91_09071 [Nostoc flagelliforme CCNUN1]